MAGAEAEHLRCFIILIDKSGVGPRQVCGVNYDGLQDLLQVERGADRSYGVSEASNFAQGLLQRVRPFRYLLFEAGICVLQAVRHTIEILGQLSKFVPGINRKPRLTAPRLQTRRPATQRLDWPNDSPSEHYGGAHRDGTSYQQNCAGPRERGE